MTTLCGYCLRDQDLWDVRGDILYLKECPSCHHLRFLYEVKGGSVLKADKPKVKSAPKFGERTQK